MYDGSLRQSLYERIAHVGHGGGAVHAAFLLHLGYDALDGLARTLGEPQGVHDALVALHYLGGGEAQWYPGHLGVALYEVAYGVEAAVYGTAVVRGRAEVLHGRRLLVFRHVQGVAHQFVDTLVLHCRYGDDGDAQPLLHLVDEHRAAVALHLVHHV